MARRHCAGLVPKVRSPPFTAQQTTKTCRCDANPENLDAGGARLRSQRKTEFLISNWDPGTLWTDFGVRADIVVSLPAEIYYLLPEHP